MNPSTQAHEWLTKLEECVAVRLKTFGEIENADPDYASTTTYRWLLGVREGCVWGWWGPIQESTARQCERFLRPLLDGKFRKPEEWRELVFKNNRHSHTGSGAVAVGACELAMWDLIGHREKLPVSSLFFSSADPVGKPQVYASQLTIRDLPRDLCRLEQLGWDLVKVPAPTNEEEWHLLSGALDRISDMDVAIDAFGRWGVGELTLALNHDERRLAWSEEVCAPWRMHELFGVTYPTRLAGGEHVYSVAEALILECAKIDIWQPDATFCGYLTCRDLCNLATSTGAFTAPHGGSLLPAVHLCLQGIRIDMVEWHLRIEPFRQAHLTSPAMLDSENKLEFNPTIGWGGRLREELLG